MANASNSTMNIPNTFNLTGTWQNNIDPLNSRSNTQQTTRSQQQTRQINNNGRNSNLPLNNIQPSNTTNDANSMGISTNGENFQNQVPSSSGQVLNQNTGVQNTAAARVNGSETILLNSAQNNNNQNLQNYQTLSNFVSTQIGRNATVEFLLGENSLIEKTGTIAAVGENYIPNDLYLDSDKQQIIIVTGPNMAGKSALLRQTALITLLAQIGCFVPAESARIGLVDKIFTRVGASDNISAGESTFMVEMTEASNILNNLSEHSLVLFDELGRGTSTYDGMSIAWAIVEYIHEYSKGRARTLFATHYHELNEMENSFPRIKNFNVSVREIDGKVIFLRKLMPGGSEHSFGIHVAKLAGMPKSIVKRSEQILKKLEASNNRGELKGAPTSEIADSREGMQLNFFQLDDPVLSQVRDEILGIDVNNLTPLEALNKLNDIKRIVRGK